MPHHTLRGEQPFHSADPVKLDLEKTSRPMHQLQRRDFLIELDPRLPSPVLDRSARVAAINQDRSNNEGRTLQTPGPAKKGRDSERRNTWENGFSGEFDGVEEFQIGQAAHIEHQNLRSEAQFFLHLAHAVNNFLW